MGIQDISSETWAVILGAIATIGGGVAGFVRWAHSQFVRFVGWGKPLVENVIDGHVDFLNTVKEKQVETTDHINEINSHLRTVQTTLGEHGEKLTRIEQHTCRTGTTNA